VTTTYGLTSAGFTPKTTEVIQAEVEADQLADVDATLDLSADQPLGQFNGIFASKTAELWELMATIYKALDPDQSEDAQLDAACALTGTKRESPKRSTVTATVNLAAGKTFTPGQMIANVNGQPTQKFRNRDTVTSVAAGNYTPIFESVDYGPIVANAGMLTVITTPLSGWNSITNALDAELGALQEDNTTLRVRRRVELAAPGACTLDSVRADVLGVAKVQQCVVLENAGLVTDGNGLPAKSFNVVLFDGVSPAAVDGDIAKAIWNSKPSGMQSYGTLATGGIVVLDSLGASHLVNFSRATQRAIYFALTVLTDPTKFPADGAAQIKAALVALGASAQIGDDVYAARFKAEPIIKIAGVLDVTSFALDFVSSPSATINLPISAREIATFDTSRITVTVT
jgi:uncharacterized phage protein gp47/JayE